MRLLFGASLVWAVLGVFMEPIFEWVPEKGRAVIEAALVATVTIACGAVVWAMVKRRPAFMRVPAGIPVAFWVTRSIVIVPLAFVLIAVVAGVLAFVGVRLTGNPTDTQYGVPVAWAIVWYPAALTPVVSVIALWTASLRRPHQ